MSLFDSGIIPVINNHLLEESKKVRDYGNFWSASSAGYCNRRLIFERLKIPYVTEDARKQRVFSSGHVFHEWIQKITKDAGLSIAQELELQDEELMIRGHVDDLVLLEKPSSNIKLDITPRTEDGFIETKPHPNIINKLNISHLILYDYKTAHSKWFEYAKKKPVSYYNRQQVGTYLMMVRSQAKEELERRKNARQAR